MAATEGRRRIWYLLVLFVIIYVLMSAAIAVSTSDDCGQLRSQKHWVYFPPKWECGS
jgi:hypothetical protein